jgi:hypothetical protein
MQISGTQHQSSLLTLNSKRLAVNLLKRLYDEQLTLRTQAASLFAILGSFLTGE